MGNVREQASRCMDCGTPFCHWGCPVGNYIPEWNDLACNDQWERAFRLLDAANCLPEVTGRVCPAVCEYACVLGINDDPVTIRENELAIVEHAFNNGLIKPDPPKERTGKRVAVVGSGPAGLACAVRLNKLGHLATVFERDDRIGGIMRYGIPDFKLEKNILDRRINIWEKEGILFRAGVNAVAENIRGFDAICLAGGSRVPRDLKVPGRELKGIYFAMDYLVQANKKKEEITAKGKKVVVIGGGDTGADCVGTAHRQGAARVTQIEILPEPPQERPASQPWPRYFRSLNSYDHEVMRLWSAATKSFRGMEDEVRGLRCIRVDGQLKDIPGTEFEIEADLVILAMGFLHPEHNGLLAEIGVEFDARGNVKTDGNYMTSLKGVFSAGDMRRGQSLVVWAIYEGAQAAEAIDRYLKEKK